MMTTANQQFLIILISLHAVYGVALGILASKWKNRSFKNWFVLGYFLSIPALLALLVVPKIKEVG